jgi:hypothetical protein
MGSRTGQVENGLDHQMRDWDPSTPSEAPHQKGTAQYTEYRVTLRADPSGQVEQGAWELGKLGALRACGWCYLWVCCGCAHLVKCPKYYARRLCGLRRPRVPPGSPSPSPSPPQEIMPPSHRGDRFTIILESSILEWVCTSTRHTSLLWPFPALPCPFRASPPAPLFLLQPVRGQPSQI